MLSACGLRGEDPSVREEFKLRRGCCDPASAEVVRRFFARQPEEFRARLRKSEGIDYE